MLKYRLAEHSDIRQLSALLRQVYIDTYGIEGVSAEFANFIHSEFQEIKLKQEIDSEDHDIWITTYRSNLVGAAKIPYSEPCPINDFSAPEINKLYVLKSFFGKNIGQELMQRAEKRLKDKGEKKTWLWVLNSNQRAIDFYHKQGYEDIGTAYFQMETNRYKNIVMLKNL